MDEYLFFGKKHWFKTLTLVRKVMVVLIVFIICYMLTALTPVLETARVLLLGYLVRDFWS